MLCCHEEDKRYLLTKPSSSESGKSDSRSKSKRGYVDNFKGKNQTMSDSADSLGTIESKRNTFVVHVTDGQVRVRGVSTGEHSRSLVRNLRLSGESGSSSEQSTNHIQHHDSNRNSTASAASEASENTRQNQR